MYTLHFGYCIQDVWDFEKILFDIINENDYKTNRKNIIFLIDMNQINQYTNTKKYK